MLKIMQNDIKVIENLVFNSSKNIEFDVSDIMVEEVNDLLYTFYLSMNKLETLARALKQNFDNLNKKINNNTLKKELSSISIIFDKLLKKIEKKKEISEFSESELKIFLLILNALMKNLDYRSD